MSKLKNKLTNIFTISTIFNMGLFFYFILNQLHYIFAFTGIVQFLVVGSINAIGIIMLIVTMLKKMDKKVLLTTVLLLIFTSISTLANKNFDVLNYISVLRYMGIVMFLLHYKQDYKMTTLIMYTTLLLFVPVLLEDLGYNMFLKASRNYYSIILLMPNFLFNKSYWDLKKNAPAFPTIASTFICLFAGGRGGIIVYVVFFFATMLMNFKFMKQCLVVPKYSKFEDTKEIPIITEDDLIEEETVIKNRFFETYKKEILVLIIIILAFVVLFAFKYIDKKYDLFDFKVPGITDIFEDNKTDSSYGFEGKGIKSKTRAVMIETYVKHMFTDFQSFFNGVDLALESIFVKYNLNPHNSFIALHSNWGILGLLLCAYLGIRALVIMIKRRDWEHILIYMAILLRVFLDKSAFPGQLDILIFYYFFRFYDVKFKELKDRDKIINLSIIKKSK